ncbi:MAG: hypothetical protein KBC43_09680 [Bacteroidales bacterium]|nr:hypothetical protein [Bacteroidales bacterium]
MKPQAENDDLIRNLVRRKGIEKAPDHFTDKVMERINSPALADDSPLISRGTLLAIIVGVAAMIVVILTVDIPYFDNLFSSDRIQKISMNIFTDGFFRTMASFFREFSSITWVVIGAALGLVLIDRILRKRFSETKGMMIW